MESPVDLARAVEQLFRWEKDFHGESNIEALACWRLHLGSSETLEQIVGSVEKPGMFSQVYQKYMPTKNKMRKARQSLPPSIRPVTEATYKVLNTIYYLIVPFIGASLFYFDLIKDMVFTAMTYRALADLTQENYSPANYPFETTVLVSMMVAIAVAQILFAVLASFYSNEVFEMCDHTSSVLKKQIFRVISFVCAPLMPAFVLANHVYYLRVEYTEKRVLQTLTGDCREAKLKVFQVRFSLFTYLPTPTVEIMLHFLRLL